MVHNTICHRRHAPVLAALHTSLIGICLPDDLDRREGNAHSKLYDTGTDEVIFTLFKEGIAENAGIPIPLDKFAFSALRRKISRLLYDLASIPSAVFEDQVLLFIFFPAEFFRQCFEKRRIVLILVILLDQITQLPLEGDRRDLPAAVVTMSGLAIAVRIAVWV